MVRFVDDILLVEIQKRRRGAGIGGWSRIGCAAELGEVLPDFFDGDALGSRGRGRSRGKRRWRGFLLAEETGFDVAEVGG